jgi:hypothetical protein
MENTIQYLGRKITISAVRSGSAYEARIDINGTIHVLAPLSKYPPCEFLRPEDSVNYGIEAAKRIVDRL